MIGENEQSGPFEVVGQDGRDVRPQRSSLVRRVQEEWNELCRLMVKQGSMIKLNEKKRRTVFGPFGSSRLASREPNFYLQLWQG